MTDEHMKSNDTDALYRWIDECRPYHLTAGDVHKWEIGEPHEVLILDRNFEEYGIWNKIKPGVRLPPEEFFRFNRGSVTYRGRWVWDVTLPDVGVFRHPVHISVEGLATSWSWLGVKTDMKPDDPDYTYIGDSVRDIYYIEIDSEMLRTGVELPVHREKTKIDVATLTYAVPLTRVGWRGPMIEWKYVATLPGVCWSEEK